MKSRSDLLIHNGVVTQLATLKRDLEEFTNRQPTSGQSGVLGYTIDSGNEWDMQETIDTEDIMVGGEVEITVEFTGDGTQEFPIENVFDVIFFDGIGEGHELTLSPSGLHEYEGEDGFVVVDLFFWGKRDISALTDPYIHRWTYFLYFQGKLDVYFKARVSGTSPGTMNVNRVVDIYT